MMADQYIRIVEDTSLNGATVELADGKERKVVILRYPHIEGIVNERTLYYIKQMPGLKEVLTPDGVSTQVDRSKINLEDKIALITGASRRDGIGFNVAAALCERGYV